MRQYTKYLHVTLLLLFVISLSQHIAYTQSLKNDRAEWFVDARFGMFIHWGVYSGAEGYWKGEKLRYDNNYAEWIKYRNRIDDNEYLSLLDKFDWDQINPEEWVLLAKRAGMKYLTVTAKHHDGFALWNSKSSAYNVANHTNPQRDIIRELADACKKHQIKLGLYYSHWVDWEHPDGWDHTREISGLSNEDYDRYWQQKVMPQMRELLTDYGDIGLIWFDMWVHHSKTVVSKSQLLQLKAMIRELQPNCLVNSRLGLSVEEDRDVDFQTLGDNQLGSKKMNHPFQTSATVAHSWGFHSTDSEWKSTTTLLKALIGNVSLNGNYMLNIGPRANGDVPFEISQRLNEMGKWLSTNGEAIYNCEAFDLRKDLHDWGKMTYKKENNKHKVYLHLFNWPLSKQLKVAGIKNTPSKIYSLADKSKSPYTFAHKEVVTIINLAKLQPDPYVSVVVLEYERKPEFYEGLVAPSISGGYSMLPKNTIKSEGSSEIIRPQHFGSIPSHIEVDQASSYSWQVYIDEAGTYSADISYASQYKSNKGEVTLRLSDTSFKKNVRFTGQTVGEPGENWHIDSFESKRMGELKFESPGFYTIELNVDPQKKEPVKFQWIWLQKTN